MRSETAVRVLFSIFLALCLYLVVLIFKPFLPGITWAVVLAVAFHPLYRRLVGWLRGREWIAASLLSILVAAFIVVPVVLAVVKLGQGLAEGYAWIQTQQATGDGSFTDLERLPAVVQLRDWLGQYVDVSQIDLRDLVVSTLQSVGNMLVGKTRVLVTNVIETIVTLLVLLVTMAVLFHESGRVLRYVRQTLPLSAGDRDAVLLELEAVTRSVFFGVLVTALIQGILGGLGFLFVGLPAAGTFGAAMFFCALLPIGTAVIWGPAVLWLFLEGHPIQALVLLVWGVAIVSTVDNVLRPYLVGRGLKIHTLLVYFAIFGGIYAFGLVGLFIGPIVVSLFLFLLGVLRRDFLGATDDPEGKVASTAGGDSNLEPE